MRFSGAAALCAGGAMRAGAGLVTLGVPEGIAGPLIEIKPKEAMILPLPQTREGALSLAGYGKIRGFAKSADVIALGPGLTRNRSTQSLVRRIILQVYKPMVIDADGLNALVGHLDLLKAGRKLNCARILTPHPGEMGRLLGVSIKKVQKNREKISGKFAKNYKVTLVLKGHNTVIADHGAEVYINETGNPGMATAGSGDVLTGMIAAFLAQGLGVFDAAKYAVHLHGLAADLAAKEKTQMGMIASDIIDKIPEAVKKCR